MHSQHILTYTHTPMHAHNTFIVGQLKKAVENAATFIALEPSDVTMANNIRYYKSHYKLSNELFVPRDVSLSHVCEPRNCVCTRPHVLKQLFSPYSYMWSC